jgi:membrane protease YdiL (CAAX protease family)
MFKRRELPEFLNVPWRVRDVAVFVVAWFGLQLFIGAVLAVTAPMAPAVAGFLNSVHRGDIGASFALNLTGVGLGLGLVAVYLRRYKVGWATVGWRRAGVLRSIKYLFGILLVFVILANLALALVKLLVPGFDIDQSQSNEFTSAVHTHRSLALVALVLIPPIFEETIFRGFIFPALSKRTGMIWGALLSSVIFGIAHGQPNLFVYTTILGLLLCFMYVRLGSIVPGIFVHMLNNYLAFIALSGK